MAMRSSRAVQRRAYGRIPYTMPNATASTAAAVAIVRRSRGSSARLCTEGQGEAFVRLAAFAIPRRRGEEARVRKPRVAVERRENRGRVRGRPIDAPLVTDRARVEHR